MADREAARPYERNPRTHSEAQVDQIAASMVEFGWTNPILIDENAGNEALTMTDFGRSSRPNEIAHFVHSFAPRVFRSSVDKPVPGNDPLAVPEQAQNPSLRNAQQSEESVRAGLGEVLIHR